MVGPATEEVAPKGLLCPVCGTSLSEVSVTRKGFGCVVRKRKCFNDHTYVTEEFVCATNHLSKVERAAKRAKRKEREGT